MTLGSSEGLPGKETTKDGVNVMLYQSGIIKPGKALQTLRFTVHETRSNATPNGNAIIFALSELKVYTADMKEELYYEVTSNADHNSLTGGSDGGGLDALWNGKFNDYFHSMYAENGAVTENHYLELTFDEPVDEFILEWGARPGNPKDAPTVVVLTEGGKTSEPYTDRSFTKKDQLTTIDALKGAQYILMRGNASETYDEREHANGGYLADDKKGLEGVGEMFVTMGETAAKEPTIDYVIQLIPVPEATDKYYIYYPNQEKYLSANHTDNDFGLESQNGWQRTTAKISDAAAVTFTQKDSDFEISYEMVTDEENFTIYIGADPRSGKIKSFSKARKEALVKNGYCEYFGIECAFNWSFFAADYQAPTWATNFKLGLVYIKALSLKNSMKQDNTFNISTIVAELETLLTQSLSSEDAKAKIEDYKNQINSLINKKIQTEYTIVNGQEANKYNAMASDQPVEGMCSKEAYNTYIKTNIVDEIGRLYNLRKTEFLYDHTDEVVAYFKSKQDNIDAYLDTKYVIHTFPFAFTAKGNALGSLTTQYDNNNRYEWIEKVLLKEPTDGFRMTFMDTYRGGSANMYNNVPVVALAAMEITDKDGNVIELNEELVTSNSIETAKDNGAIANMFDNDITTFYHSIWSEGSFEGYVYLDIKFPEGTTLDQFTIKTVSREHQSAALAPKSVRFTAYGKVYDPIADRPNIYNVKIGNKVTDPANLKDGGLYVISGNLKGNLNAAPEDPCFYSGKSRYSTNEVAAANDTCVYLLNKNEDGSWNVMSLGAAKYWTIDGDLTMVRKEAAKIKIAKSNNMEDAMVMYSDIPDTTLVAKWEWSQEGKESISIPEQNITVNKMIYMDWHSGLTTRPRVSEQPGEFTYGKDIIDAHEDGELMIMGDGYSAGDDLHFNKTNGEGEWNIYEVTMDTPYFVYIKNMLNHISETGLDAGIDPGCVKLDEATLEQYENAKAAADYAVKNNKTSGAETTANTLIDLMDVMADAERIGFAADTEYLIQSALPEFYQKTGFYKAMSVNTETEKLVWGSRARNFINKNNNFLFKLTEVNAENQGSYGVEVPEADMGKTFYIENVETGLFVGCEIEEGGDQYVPMTAIEQAQLFAIEHSKGRVFNIRESGTNECMHAEGHGSGGNASGEVILYGDKAGASTWQFFVMNDERKKGIFEKEVEEPENSIESVIEGDEVIAVEYYTVAGVAIPTLEKGINIVIKRYANGVVEATKVLVK